MIYPISGAHLNPAITIAVTLLMKMPIFKGLTFVIGQIIGAIIGAYLLKLAIPSPVTDALQCAAPQISINGTTLVPLGNSISVVNACFMDIFLSFFVIMAFLLSSKFSRDSQSAGFWMPVVYGSAVLTTILFASPLTGVGPNPLQALGPSVVAGNFDSHWVYWIGSIVGAIFASIIYKIFQQDHKQAGN